MNMEEAKTYIETVSQTGSILGLENIQNLMRELSDIQEKLRIIHIAGTNGKGSTGAFIESTLIEAGYRVGRYTSPAVFDAFEVWRINKENITQKAYLSCLAQVKEACERMLAKGLAQPTVFEIETALSFVYFYEEKCDYVLLEVGMGGATDATNLITHPVCSVITSISRDHMQFLGNSLTEIAAVKAGIIKAGCPVVTIDTQKPEVLQTIRKIAEQKGAELILAGQGELHAELSMKADYQIENSNLASTVCKKVLAIPDEMIQKGIAKTTWPGRFEQISEHPLVFIDGAHNEDAAKKLAATLQKHFTNRKIVYIIGVLADKEHKKILEIMLPYAVRVYTVTPANKRGLDGHILAEEAEELGKMAVCCDSIKEAATLAVQDTAEGNADMILAFGSLSYLAELKACMLR